MGKRRRLVCIGFLAVAAVLAGACDLPWSMAGGPCSPDGEFAQDGTHVLKCENGRWVPGLTIADADAAFEVMFGVPAPPTPPPPHPFGAVDHLRQRIDGIELAGWAIDPDTTASLKIRITDNGQPVDVIANGRRDDLAGFGKGVHHGFSRYWKTSPGNHRVCVTAFNVGPGKNTTLQCKSVHVAEVSHVNLGVSGDVYALLEVVEPTSKGWHFRGFVVRGPAQGWDRPPAVIGPPWGTPYLAGMERLVDRPDVAAHLGAPSVKGFDFYKIPGSVPPEVCILLPVDDPVSCRPV